MITKETLESWYTPKEKKNVTVLNLTDEEEDVAEEDVCELCEGTGEVNEYATHEGNFVWDGTKPCICQEQEDFVE